MERRDAEKMSFMESLLILSEHEHLKQGHPTLPMSSILDNHKMHIRAHLYALLFPRYWLVSLRFVGHIVEHLWLWYHQRKAGIRPVSMEDVMNSQRKNND